MGRRSGNRRGCFHASPRRNRTPVTKKRSPRDGEQFQNLNPSLTSVVVIELARNAPLEPDRSFTGGANSTRERSCEAFEPQASPGGTGLTTPERSCAVLEPRASPGGTARNLSPAEPVRTSPLTGFTVSPVDWTVLC